MRLTSLNSGSGDATMILFVRSSTPIDSRFVLVPLLPTGGVRLKLLKKPGKPPTVVLLMAAPVWSRYTSRTIVATSLALAYLSTSRFVFICPRGSLSESSMALAIRLRTDSRSSGVARTSSEFVAG